MGKIHLVARRSDQHASNFYRLRDGVYLSGWWAFSDDAAQRLVEGSIFLHETKNVASRGTGATMRPTRAPRCRFACDHEAREERSPASHGGSRAALGTNRDAPS